MPCGAGNLELPGTYISATVLGMLLTANYMHFARVYSLSSLRRQAVEVAKVVAAWVAVFATLVVVSLLTDTSELFSARLGRPLVQLQPRRLPACCAPLPHSRSTAGSNPDGWP